MGLIAELLVRTYVNPSANLPTASAKQSTYLNPFSKMKILVLIHGFPVGGGGGRGAGDMPHPGLPGHEITILTAHL
jgi:hypothetical protein